jgi:DUF1009 family protein
MMPETPSVPTLDPTAATTGFTRIGLIAGEGELPVQVAQNAARQGLTVAAFSIGLNNRKALKRHCAGGVFPIVPGLVSQTLHLLKREGIRHLVFAGKVNKWILLCNPRMDERAWSVYKAHRRKNDDKVMQVIIEELAKEGITVLSQTDYLQNLFLPAGLLTPSRPPSLEEEEDIRYGFEMAKEMGRLDIGQTIVVRSGMVLAVEAIEGTDECLKRGGRWSKKGGGVVVKVAKPDQDNRFDVPTVGLRTLKVMKRCGLRVLATEANQTLFLEPDEMVAYATRHGLTITSVSPEDWS